MDETMIIDAFLNGNDELLENADYMEIDVVALHEQGKLNTANKRKATFKARKHKKNIPVTAVDEAFYPMSAKEKKAYKKASSKANRRAKEMVNSSRSLNHKVYGDFDDRLKNQMKATKGWNFIPGYALKKEQGK